MIVILGLFLVVPDRHRALGEHQRLARQRAPARGRGRASWARELPAAARRGRADPQRLRARRSATPSTTCCSSCRSRRCSRWLWPCWSTSAMLKGRSFFRTAYYFPSVTSSIAIATVFLFLFSDSRSVNAFLAFVGIDGPAVVRRPPWPAAPGLQRGSGWRRRSGLARHGHREILGRTFWDWLSGPSVAMFTIIFLVIWVDVRRLHAAVLAALQSILPVELDEAACPRRRVAHPHKLRRRHRRR